jgi:hypothetical protein
MRFGNVDGGSVPINPPHCATSLLTVSDVSLLLKVRPKRVRELIHDHYLTAIDIAPSAGRPTYRIDPEDLRKFQNGQRTVKPETQRRRTRIADTEGIIEFYK